MLVQVKKPQLRPYQIESKDEIKAAIAAGHARILVQQPTGTGKSVQQVDLVLDALELGQQVLIVVPTVELVKNLAEYFLGLGVKVSYVQGARATLWTNRLVIGTVKTIYNRLSANRFPPHFQPALVLHDECQHSPSNQWRFVMEYYRDSIQIGFSATPRRLDGKSFADLFHYLVPGKQIKWYIENGYLAPFRIFVLPVLQVKFKKVRGEYSLSEQSDVYDVPKVIGDVVETWRQHTLGQKTLVFATSVEHSKHIVEAYNKLGQELYGRAIAVHVDSATPKKEREEALERLSLPVTDPRAYMIASNVQLFTEGVNLPSVSCVQMCRLTASLSLYLQVIGRVLRPQDGKVAVILDHVGNIGIHKRPDYDRRWRLTVDDEEEDEKPDPYALICGVCGTVVAPDYREYEPEMILDCPCCGASIMVPGKHKPKPRGERKPIENDLTQELIEMTADNVTRYEINLLAMKAQNNGYSRKRFVKSLALIRNLTLDDLIYACEAMGYSQHVAIGLWSRWGRK